MDIRPAATLVLVRDTSDGLEVLLLQRTWDAVFMPGYFVFPGGRVEEDETHGQEHVIGAGDAEISQIMSVDEGGADYMLAAVRECFEESGVLVAVDKQGNPISGDHPVHADRKSVFDGELSLANLCEKYGLAIPLDRLAYLGHWITPPGPPRRFDTRFFVTPAPEGQLAGHDGWKRLIMSGFARSRPLRIIGMASGCWGCRRSGRCGCSVISTPLRR